MAEESLAPGTFPPKTFAPVDHPLDRSRRARLVLDDGSVFEGYHFGAEAAVSGEVVFATGMVGYPESMTDPSYRGQILTFTYPLIGNYGVPPRSEGPGLPEGFESDRIQTSAIIVSTLSGGHTHWSAGRSLEDWMIEEGIPGLSSIDTRALTRRLRARGTTPGRIEVDGIVERPEFTDAAERNLVAEVTCAEPILYEAPGSGRHPRVVLVDCGAKLNIIRALNARGADVLRVPYDHDLESEKGDGFLISNGPGNPKMAEATVQQVRRLFDGTRPVFGICLGNQVLSLAAGADTYKLDFGHRGQNQPCLEVGTMRCMITSQNHGYAVAGDRLPAGWSEWFVNANDHSNEGIRDESGKFRSVQFHPEATPGPRDAAGLFDRFLEVYPMSEATPEKPRKILILGSGALKIGEAGEFDYSGSQAIKAMKEEGIHTVLVNPNIATIQTSEGLADEVYFLPVNADFVERVIEKERPDSILLSFGGQTALNCGLELVDRGVLEKYDVRVLGTPPETIRVTEDRELFARQLRSIEMDTPRSQAVDTVADALLAAEEITYPVMVRAAFALGGMGSGIATEAAELEKMAQKALTHAPQILVEEYLEGWREIEYEVVRDRYDNCLTVCNMENVDALGIHTGESIVVAPSQSLTDHEYHYLRDVSTRLIRHLGVVGECNVQFALHPTSDEYRIIEVNARLSRSSALASKATGYPLAFVAAKLALGQSLHEVPNSITRVTGSCFEPALDYCVIKIPRWDLKKFKRVSLELGSEMKSVGEVMAIGRSFEEALQKACRMLGVGAHGVMCNSIELGTDAETPEGDHSALEELLATPTETRIFAIAEALRRGMPTERIQELTRITPWFLERVHEIVRTAAAVSEYSLEKIPAELFRHAKCVGFSDNQISRLVVRDTPIAPGFQAMLEARARRKELGILPIINQIDTLAAEYPAQTNYLYMTYHGSEDDVAPSESRPYIVLGGGAYRIGSSVEFDWCAVNAVQSLASRGHSTVLINFNPETVSTDYDTCDRLYFDELSLERVLDICDKEDPQGVVISVGGQIPNQLAVPLGEQGIPILGTSTDSIDRAENRERFSTLLDELGIDQPEWSELTSHEEARRFAKETGYPALIRPSYVLSGAAMSVAHSDDELSEYLEAATEVSKQFPVVISKFIAGAKEIELDGVAKDGHVVCYAISEHVEQAGVHSGDATMVFPSQRLYLETVRRIKKIARGIASALKITGPFNIQFIARDNRIQVIECNLRASRSFPFVSKVLRENFIDYAIRAMLGEEVESPAKSAFECEYVGVKAPQFSFSRLKGADPLLGVEMASTGEVACLGDDANSAYLKALLSVGFKIPKAGVLLTTGTIESKAAFLPSARKLSEWGIPLYGTPGTHAFLAEHGIESTLLYPPLEEMSPNVNEYLESGAIDLVINVPRSLERRDLSSGYLIRRKAVDFGVSLFTNIQAAEMFVEAWTELGSMDELKIKPWRAYG